MRAQCAYTALCLLLPITALAGCAAPNEPAAEAVSLAVSQKHELALPRPKRIISLDLCADQYVLKFVDRERIVALSPDADKPFSAMRGAAHGITKIDPRGENIIALAPDLVVRSYGGGAQIEPMLARAGIKVVQLGYPETLPNVETEIVRVGSALGEPQQARNVARQMRARLQAAGTTTRAGSEAGSNQVRRVLYMTPGGVSAGPGTLVDEVISAAGLANFQTEPGWQPLPLERLAYERPEIIAAADFTGAGGNIDQWSASRHPLAKSQLARADVVPISGAALSCGAWPLANAAEALAQGARR